MNDDTTPAGRRQQLYARAGAPECWQLVRSSSGHFETWDMRRRVLRFLDQVLVNP
jgi:hypothetical protein